LGSQGAKVIPALVDLVKDKQQADKQQADTRKRAMAVLAALPEGGEALLVISKELKDLRVRADLIEVAALSRYPKTVTLILDGLKDTDSVIKLASIQACIMRTNQGGNMAEALPALRELLADPNPDIRDLAHKAIS